MYLRYVSFVTFKEAITLSKDIRSLEENHDAELIHSAVLGETPYVCYNA
jgi:hypothetical protein